MKRLANILRLISIMRVVTLWAFALTGAALILAVETGPDTTERTVITCKTLGFVLVVFWFILYRR